MFHPVSCVLWRDNGYLCLLAYRFWDLLGVPSGSYNNISYVIHPPVWMCLLTYLPFLPF
jgi:hypothetical protein